MEQNETHNINNRTRKHPFTVPDGYFDNLPMQIQARVQAKPTGSLVFGPLFAPKYRLSAVLGMFLILAASVWFVLSNQQQNQHTMPQLALAQLSDVEIMSYLESDEAELETTDIALLTNFSGEKLPNTLPAYSAQDLEQELELSDIEDYYL